MYIDFLVSEIDIDDSSIKKLAIMLNSNDSVNSITAPYYLIKPIKYSITKPKNISCLIDYPLGISDLKTRQHAIKEAIKLSINCIDMVMPQNLASNRKYDKIREDVKSNIDICAEKGVQLRYILEYRVFDQYCLKKICEIFETSGYINTIFTSTSYFIDNLSDNILASVFLYKNSKNLNIISTGNIWSQKHFDLLKKSEVYGIRLNSMHVLENFISSLK